MKISSPERSDRIRRRSLMMRTFLTLSLTVLVASAALRAAEPSKDATTSDNSSKLGTLEVRAGQEFSAGNWATALPMLKKVAELVKDDPARLSSIEEQIRVCEKNIAKLASANLKSRKPGDPAAAQAGTAISVPATPAAPAIGVNRKPLTPPKSGEALELSIKELGNFEYDQEKGGNIPADVK